MLIHPYCWCPKCGECVPFPYPTHQPPTGRQQQMPTGTWQADILHIECGRLWLCKAQAVRIGLSRRPGQGQEGIFGNLFFETVHECGDGGCGLQIRAFVYTTHYATPAKAVDSLLKASLHPRCDSGHFLSESSKLLLSREVFCLWESPQDPKA